MASIGKLSLEVTADVSSLQSGLKSATSSIDSLTSNMKSASSAMSSSTSAANNATSGFNTLRNAANNLQSRLANIGIDVTEDQLADLVHSLSQSTDSMEEAEDQAYDWISALNQTSTPTSTAMRAVTNLADAIADGNIDTDTWNQALKVLPSTLQDVATRTLGAEANVSDLKKALDNGLVSVDDFADALNDSVSDADNMADALDDVESATDDATDAAQNFDLKASAAFSAVATVVNKVLSKAFDVISDSIDSAISRVDTLNNYPVVMESIGYSADEAASSIETLSNGIDGLPTSLDSIVSVTQNLAPMCDSLDEASELAIALNDAMLAGGQGTDVATNAITQFTQMLAAGKVDMDAWNTVVTAAPGQMDQLAKSMLGANATQQDLYSALQDGTISLEDFCDEIVNLDQNGGDGFSSFSEQAKASTQGIETSMENAKTAVVKNLANIIDELNSNGEISEFFDGVKDAINRVGETITNDVIPAFKEVVQWIQDNSQYFEALIPVIAGVVAAYAAFQIVQTVTQWINAAKTAFQLLNATMAANPFLLIVSVIAALVSAFITLYNTNDSFRNAIDEAWNFISSLVGSVVDAIVGFFTETIPNAINSVVTWFQELPTKIGEALSSALESISGWVTDVWNSAVEAGSNFINNIVNFFSQTPEEIGYQLGLAIGNIVNWVTETVENGKQAASQFFENIKNWFVQLPTNFKNWLDSTIEKVKTWASDLKTKATEAATNFFNNIKTKIQNLPSNFKTWLDNTISKVTSFASSLKDKAVSAATQFKDNLINGIKSIPDRVKSIGSDIVNGVWNGIKSKFTEFYNNVTGFFSGIVDGVKSALGIGSPSKVFRDEVGRWLPEGVAVGIEANSDSALDAMRMLGDELVDVPTKVDTSLIVTDEDVSSGSMSQMSSSEVKSLMAEAFTEALTKVPNVRTFDTPQSAAVWLGKAMNSQLATMSKREAVFQ